MTKALNDCFAQHLNLMPAEEALSRLRENTSPLVDSYRCPLSQAKGKILATPLISPRAIPGFDNAAVDGYAVKGSELNPNGETRFTVDDYIAAGHTTLKPLTPGNAARILTGARMPEGADTVVMQEDVRLDVHQGCDTVIIPEGSKAGINWRPAGEDMALGQEILPQGHRLRPQDIGAAAAMGFAEVDVYQPLKVAVFSTGDEIAEPGAALAEDGVYDVNRYMLAAFVRQLGAEVTDLGILQDNAEAVTRALEQAAQDHHVVLTSGGASTGDEDHIATAMNTLGAIHFWRLAIKPGRPLAFGHIDHKDQSRPFIGFPGNPVATGVCFMRFGFPLLAALNGQTWPEPQFIELPATFSLRKRAGRREWLRAQLQPTDSGQPGVNKHPKQGSGILTSLVDADGLIEVPEDVTEIKPGDLVLFLPFSQFNLA